MTQGLLLWRPCPHSLNPSLPSIHLPLRIPKVAAGSAAIVSTADAERPPSPSPSDSQLSARERRQLRNLRRESRAAYNWREEVEERLIKKPKKRYASWTEELNLDNLALVGPQWWIVRVSRVRGQETADVIARLLVREFPEVDFQVYAPAIQERRKLKNGTVSIKPKPLFPGCVFLRCVLNKELHDFIREVDGVGGFVGSKVGNTKKQINKPRPVSSNDMEAIFKKAKEEQEKTNKAFEEEEKAAVILDPESLGSDDSEESTSKQSRQTRKSSTTRSGGKEKPKPNPLVPGSTVEVLSGTFAGFEGNLKKVNRRSKKATVGFTLFGKETLVELHVTEIVSQAK
ncbi:hypothetical protein SAY86_025346 [Trapa natans]|uniref:NusG-like N-terminal domain-containing protein n=1 Tax=Trapa natans TaxID=22666 RepID=A0AAN7RIW4_TRANT|nr:hypothetical protein SAY86_025346 [Trapa natans]